MFSGVGSAIFAADSGTKATFQKKNSDPECQLTEKRVDDLVHSALDAIAIPNVTSEKVRAKFKELLDEYFAVEEIGTFVLGRHNKDLGGTRRSDFLKHFRNMLVHVYSSKFSEYKNANVTISNSKKNGQRVMVYSVIAIPGKEEVNVVWHLKSINGKWMITDVNIQNIGMRKTQNRDICGRIGQVGMDKFLKELQEKYGE
ncbi:MAG: ABC transporter substrate-binding protein [Holosporaceae bacterium]|nr:ABC transporter substrate-binding protein [Holosporaceae bacterium]